MNEQPEQQVTFAEVIAELEDIQRTLTARIRAEQAQGTVTMRDGAKRIGCINVGVGLVKNYSEALASFSQQREILATDRERFRLLCVALLYRGGFFAGNHFEENIDRILELGQSTIIRLDPGKNLSGDTVMRAWADDAPAESDAAPSDQPTKH